MKPLTASTALDRTFLETRCKLLEIAANLDRIARGENAAAAVSDPRYRRIREALSLLVDSGPTDRDRAEQVQQLFSQAYDPSWQEK
ncbi:MAG: hypothetical protein KF841_06330 [Phycisphaerae bacterium]|nr:hypothetical protein [Phycisphaerae bacterium]